MLILRLMIPNGRSAKRRMKLAGANLAGFQLLIPTLKRALFSMRLLMRVGVLWQSKHADRPLDEARRAIFF
jgi:hypothetical protein